MWIENHSGEILQGTIVSGIPWGYEESQSPLGIVLSNACDLSHPGHSSFLIVAALASAKEVLTNLTEFKNSLKPDKSIRPETAKNFFEKFIHNKNVARYYFIGKNDDVGIDEYLIVDFQHILSFKPTPDLESYAQLKHPFVEQMMMQYAAYTSRIPSQRVEGEELQKIINDLAEDYLPKGNQSR